MKITAENLVSILVELGEDVRDYSGRGMYGERCVGINVSSANAVQFGFQLACDIGIRLLDELGSMDAQDVLDELSGLEIQTDSLGKGIIVYFPKLKWSDECDRLVAEGA